MPFEHFHQAQDQGGSGYANALAEIRSGRKRSHWIWYVLPQIEGLGSSHMARTFALSGLEDAANYLRDSVLRSRYKEIAAAIADQLKGGAKIERLMGGPIDAQKLSSSLTLFRAAAAKLDGKDSDLGRICGEILRMTAAQGYPPCRVTLEKT